MSVQQYYDEITKGLAQVEGTDGRQNVSSRSDNRGYYNSRDKGLAFSAVWEHPSAADGEYSLYIQNTSTTSLTMVIRSVGLNADDKAKFTLERVTGTVAGGTDVTPANLNDKFPNVASAVIKIDASGTAISGLTTAVEIDSARVVAGGHEELRIDDMLRISQNGAVALKLVEGTSTPDAEGVIFFYFE